MAHKLGKTKLICHFLSSGGEPNLTLCFAWDRNAVAWPLPPSPPLLGPYLIYANITIPMMAVSSYRWVPIGIASCPVEIRLKPREMALGTHREEETNPWIHGDSYFLFLLNASASHGMALVDSRGGISFYLTGGDKRAKQGVITCQNLVQYLKNLI